MTVRQRAWSSAAAEAAAQRVHEEKEADEAAAVNTPLMPHDATLLQKIGTSAIPDEDSGPRTGPKAVVMLQGKPLLFLMLTWILFVFYILHPSSGPFISGITEPSEPSDVPRARQNHATSKNPPANLHLVVPASKSDENLCKVMVSAGILGYPDPVIVNWGENFDDPKFVEGGSHLAKVTGITRYLNSLNSSMDDDLVLMVDGYDVWLQLRPQTLVDRYFAINKRADARIARELGEAASEHNIHQQVIFGCQKRCWPWTENDPPCYAVPFSDLPEDVYGPDTDTDVGNEENPYIKYRPRYINSGVVMGTVKALRKIFDQALELLVNDPFESNMGSDQYIFSHILGDQEVWREALRQDSLTNLRKAREKVHGGYEPLHPFQPSHVAEVRNKAARRPDGSFEFGIGLDYRMEIGLNTVFSEDDTAWLHWTNTSELAAASQRENISSTHPHGVLAQQHLAPDITDTTPPFWTFNHDARFPRWTPWSAVPLFTNLWSGVVPAVIHHNAHRNGSKILRETWWNQTWYAGHTRSLYDAHIWEPVIPVAYGGKEEADLREYWPGERWKGGGRTGPKEVYTEWDARWVRFDDICREYHEEVFRDGLGEWVLPDVH